MQEPPTLVGMDAAEAPELSALVEHFPEFELRGLLGRGGMGAVYRATHRELNREVAIKILPLAAADSPEFAERFRREARALAALDHPNIVTLHDFGERGGWFYFVMEFVDGSDLAARIAAGSMSTDEALAIVPQLCGALDYSHGKGVVHRDIKPANILIDRRGLVKIADFGLAKLVGPAAGEFDLTKTQTALGTPRYMAPEQMTASPAADHRADIYALGVVFYELLTGEVPAGSFDPPSRRTEGLGDHFDDLIIRAMRDEPERRFQSAAELSTSLTEAMALRRTVPGGKRQMRRQFLLRRALPLAIVAAVAGVVLASMLKDHGSTDGSMDPSLSMGNPPSGPLADFHRSMDRPIEAIGGQGSTSFSVHLSEDGRASMQGDNSYGQKSLPKGLEAILAVDAAEGSNGAHTLALRADGRVFAWGDDTYGQCQVPKSAKSEVVSIAAGEFHSIALRSDGSIVIWGHSRDGCIDIPSIFQSGSIQQIAAGARFNVVLMDNGSIHAWGANDSGQCDVPSIDQPIRSIGAHGSNAWIEMEDGSIAKWGQ